MRLPGKDKAVSLTLCWSWDETLLRLPGREIKLCHSLPVGYGMVHDGIPVKESCHHSPTVGYGMRHYETTWHRKNVVYSLSVCE